MPAYPNQANNDLLERIPLSAGIVLDVGCNTGALGAAYRRLNPRARC
jgi:16S rRNA G1207 methylase RsmC